MITRDQAFNIAKQIVPDIELRGVRISDTLSDNKMLGILPKDCWYVSYFPVLFNHTACSSDKIIFLCINKSTGEILYHNHL